MVMMMIAMGMSVVSPHGDHFLVVVVPCLGLGRSEAHLD